MLGSGAECVAVTLGGPGAGGGRRKGSRTFDLLTLNSKSLRFIQRLRETFSEKRAGKKMGFHAIFCSDLQTCAPCSSFQAQSTIP